MAQFVDTFAPLRQSLANLAQQRKEAPVREMQLMQLKQMKEQQEQEKGLSVYVAQNPDMDQDLAAFKYWGKVNPTQAQSIAQGVMKQADTIGKFDKAAAVKYINTKLGTQLELTSEDGEYTTITDKINGKVKRLDQKGNVVWEHDIGVEKPKETDAEKRQAEYKLKTDFEKFKDDLDKKYKDTPEGIQAKKIELEKIKAGLENKETSDEKRQAELQIKKDLIDYENKFKLDHPELGSNKGLMDENQKRLLAKDLADAEEKIINNADNEAVRGTIRLFNQYSKTPYMFIWKEEHKKPGDFLKTKGKAERIDLPVLEGKQVTSEDIRFTAEKYEKSIKDVLKELGVL